jgi:hypothetical protein
MHESLINSFIAPARNAIKVLIVCRNFFSSYPSMEKQFNQIREALKSDDEGGGGGGTFIALEEK